MSHCLGVLCSRCHAVLVPDRCPEGCPDGHGFSHQEPGPWAAATWPEHACFATADPTEDPDPGGPVVSAVRAEIGRRVRHLRKDAGIRQLDVAAAARRHGLAWTASKVAALEAGNKAISVEELLLLPGVLTESLGAEVRLEDLLADLPVCRPACDPYGDEAGSRAARRLGLSQAGFRAACVAAWGRSMVEEREARLDVHVGRNAGARNVQAIRGQVTRSLMAELTRQER